MNRATVWRAVLLGLVTAGCGGGAAARPAGGAAAAAAAAEAEDGAPATRVAARTRVARRVQVPPDTTLPVEYRREVFRYGGGARDPFESPLTTGDLGPAVGDLDLVAITFDSRYGNSVAIVRDTSRAAGGARARDIPRRYVLRRGDAIGRMRVIQIRQYEVVFQIEEYGFERQEVLALRRPEVTR